MESEATVVEHEQPASAFTSMSNRNLGRVAVIGLLAGILLWFFARILGQYVFQPMFCSGEALRCGAVANTSEVTSAIIVAIVALVALVKAQTYRPLVVVLASIVSLWGLAEIMSTTTPYIVALVSGALYAVAFLLFTWILRLRVFWLALGITTLFVVVLRFILAS